MKDFAKILRNFKYIGNQSNTNIEEPLILDVFVVFQFYVQVCYFDVIRTPVQNKGNDQ